MRPIIRNGLYALLTVGWLGAAAMGGWKLWKFDSTPGAPAMAPSDWPKQTSLKLDPHVDTLVLMLHPQCGCSRATVEELNRLITNCYGKIAANVLVLRPAQMPEGWEKTDLWTSAAAIPGVHVISDVNGREARQFGAATSGEALLYNPQGRLLFSGGITESRGHSGDNAGRSAITALVLGSTPIPHIGLVRTAVYGCPLFGPCSTNIGGTTISCRK